MLFSDGGIATIRPAAESDRQALKNFYQRVSDRSKYLRFFGTHPELSDSDLEVWLHNDGRDHVTLAIEEHGRIIAIAAYQIVPELLPKRVGDVSFLVQDDQQGRGVGNLLLEHLADIGRECDVERFTAEMLTQNRQMKRVFIGAGYSVHPELADGTITVDFPIAPSETSRGAMERREQRAEANSLRRAVSPATVAVLQPCDVDTPDFRGTLLRPTSIEELERAGTRVDAVVSQFDAAAFPRLVEVAAGLGASVIVLPDGGDQLGLSPDRTAELVALVREHGMRLIGPSSTGVINTDPGVRLNLTPLQVTPRRGRVGILAQTAGVSTLLLSRAVERGSGISTFVSTGLHSDVTANDVIQFWASDDRTRVCLLSIDSIGNPRKFFRVLRRLAQRKHVVVFMPSRALESARHHHQSVLVSARPEALDAVIRHSGALVVTRRDTMYDIAQLLVRQPLPRGRRVAVISNSRGIARHMEQSARRFGLDPIAWEVASGEPVGTLATAVDAALGSSDIDAVVVTAVARDGEVLRAVHRELTARAARCESDDLGPLVASYIGFDRPPLELAGEEEPGQLPVCDTYREAMEALSIVTEAELHAAPTATSNPEPTPAATLSEVRAVIESVLADTPEGRWATDEECAAILAAYGVHLIPWSRARTLEEALAAAEEYGWDVVLKCVSPMVRPRSELPTVFRHLRTPDALRDAWAQIATMATTLGVDDPTALDPVIQPTVPPGTSIGIRALEDPAIGPIMGVGIAGLLSELVGDLAWRTPPMSRDDAFAMLRELRGAPLLTGYRGAPASDLEPVADILLAVSRMGDDNPALVETELSPVIAGVESTQVVGARIRIAPLGLQRDPLVRTVG